MFLNEVVLVRLSLDPVSYHLFFFYLKKGRIEICSRNGKELPASVHPVLVVMGISCPGSYLPFWLPAGLLLPWFLGWTV